MDHKSDVVVRSCAKSDLEAVKRLCAQAKMGELSSYDNITVAADADGSVLGFFRIVQSKGEQYLSPIVIDEKARGSGLGRVLIEAALHEASPLLLIARGSAHAFYVKNGGQDIAWSRVSEFMAMDCLCCPDSDSCNPQPMIIEARGNAL